MNRSLRVAGGSDRLRPETARSTWKRDVAEVENKSESQNRLESCDRLARINCRKLKAVSRAHPSLPTSLSSTEVPGSHQVLASAAVWRQEMAMSVNDECATERYPAMHTSAARWLPFAPRGNHVNRDIDR